MRTLRPMREKQATLNARPTLRTDKPVAGYARRSPAYAKDEEKDKSQSREMQTEDLKEWAILQGWLEKNFYPYFADFGLSGTLAPHERPDMLRLFDDIDAGKYDHGTVLCWQENRLFRDETQIYYNQLIQKCLEHDIVIVAVSPYVMIYDFRDDFLTEMFRWKCKESAEFIKRHVKGWMLPARYRAAWIDGEWAGLGSPSTGFIVDFDEDSPTFKKIIPYMPHIEKVDEHFQLFMEVCGNISLFYRQLQQSPIIFPEFEEWVDPRNVKRFKMTKHPSGGYYPQRKSTLVSILTNPIYIGYRTVEGVIRRNGKGEKILEFEKPLVDLEAFYFAFYNLAKTDLDGNPIDRKRLKNYFREKSDGQYGLLKFRIRSNQGEVKTHHLKASKRYAANPGNYLILSDVLDHSLYYPVCTASIPCMEIDDPVVNRLMEHVRETKRTLADAEEYERKAKTLRAERASKVKQIETSIQDIHKKQTGLTISLGSVEAEIAEAEKKGDTETAEIKRGRKQLIEEGIDTLERERKKLIAALAELEAAAENDLGTLDEELEKLEREWPKYRFDHRRNLINFLVQEVVIDTVASHWIRIQVLWRHEAWGREEFYYFRSRGQNKEWSQEEEAILSASYPTMPKPDLMRLLPERGWDAIVMRANTKGIPRALQGRPVGETVGGNTHASYSDHQFIQSMGLEKSIRQSKWIRLY